MRVNTNLFPLEMSSSTTADGATASVPQNVDGHDQLQIPKAAIKRIMKLDPEVSQVANDAVVLVAKATEMFLEKFAGAARARDRPRPANRHLRGPCGGGAARVELRIPDARAPGAGRRGGIVLLPGAGAMS